MKNLSNSELLGVSGGSELTDWIVDKIGDFLCSCSKWNWGGIPASKSALHGPYARPTY